MEGRIEGNAVGGWIPAQRAKIIALDIETTNLDMKAEGLSFDDPKGWTTGCVVVYDVWNDVPHYFADVEIPQHQSEPLSELGECLEQYADDGYILLTQNGTLFDLPILAKDLQDGGAGITTQIENMVHIDPTQLLMRDTGKRYSLQKLVKGVLGDSASKSMAAALAPVEWAKGHYAEVILYCEQDCRLTAAYFMQAFVDDRIEATHTIGEAIFVEVLNPLGWASEFANLEVIANVIDY